MTLASLTLNDFLTQTAAKTPTPGGGAIACATGSMAAALAGMVVSYSLGKKTLAAHQADLEHAARTLENARNLFLTLAEEDAQAYGLVNELMKLPEQDARRQAEWPEAVRASIQVPMAAIAAAADLLRLCETLVPITNKHLHSDLGIATELALAAGRASLWNVRVNLSLLPNDTARETVSKAAQRTLDEAAARGERVCAALRG